MTRRRSDAGPRARRGGSGLALGAATLLGAAAVLGACSPDPGRDPATFAIPAATAAPIRMNACAPGTFIGTMTINCPQAVR